jgi:hypothetical protein
MKIIFISLFSLVFLAGCASDKSNNTNNVIEEINETAITEQEQTMPTPVRRAEVCSIIASDQLPANWPDDIPFYVNSTLTSVKCSPNESDSYEVRLTTTDDFDDVVSFFGTNVADENWVISSLDNIGPYGYAGYKLLNAQKEGRELIIDLRHSGNQLPMGSTEIIYRERIY